MLEVGRAQKTIFIARYLRLRDLQREIEEGLNVVESFNGANGAGLRKARRPSRPTAATSRNCSCCACGSCKRRSSTSTR
jgi:hypothetical protein